MIPHRLFLLLIIPFSLLFVLYHATTPIISFTDELIYEDLAFYVYQTNDFLTPHLRHQVWLEKPPLYSWLTAPLFHLSSPTPLVRRFWTIIPALGLILTLYLLAQKLFSQSAAQLSVLSLLTSPLFFAFTKQANLDILNTFLITLTLYFYFLSLQHPRLIYLTATVQALALLNRSFLALTPLPLIALHWLTTHPRPLPPKQLARAFLLLLLLITVPWHLQLFLRYPQQFLTEYLIFNTKYYLLQITPGHQSLGLPQPLPLFFLYLFPLFPLLFLILLKPLRQSHTTRLLFFWLALALFPFLLSHTKHEWYFLQSLPPLSILLTLVLEKLIQSVPKLLTPLLLSLLLALPITTILTHQPRNFESIDLLNRFLQTTPANTPLHNYQHQLVPNTTLFNPRPTPILQASDLSQISSPIYLLILNSDLPTIQTNPPLHTSLTLIEQTQFFSLIYSQPALSP